VLTQLSSLSSTLLSLISPHPGHGSKDGTPGGTGSQSHGIMQAGNGGFVLSGFPADAAYVAGQDYAVTVVSAAGASFNAYAIAYYLGGSGGVITPGADGKGQVQTCRDARPYMTHTEAGPKTSLSATFKAPSSGMWGVRVTIFTGSYGPGSGKYYVTTYATQASTSCAAHSCTKPSTKKDPAPTSCAGGICSDGVCCEAQTCASFACTGSTTKKAVPDACPLSGCTSRMCCDTPSCSTFTCPAGKKPKAVPDDCGALGCVAEACCNDASTEATVFPVQIKGEEMVLDRTLIGTDKIKITLTVKRQTWIGIGVSADGSMSSSGSGSDVVVCDTDGVLRHWVTGKKIVRASGIVITDASCSQKAGTLQLGRQRDFVTPFR